MKCPNCRLINPDTALRCDCGYDFQSKRIEESYFKEKTQKPTNMRAVYAIQIAMVCLAVIRAAAEGTIEPLSEVLILAASAIFVYMRMARRKNLARQLSSVEKGSC